MPGNGTLFSCRIEILQSNPRISLFQNFQEIPYLI